MNIDWNLFDKVLLLCFFILGPILPAYLLYKIAPDDKILGNGNFAGFKINATGATAIFIILFAALYPKIDTVLNTIDNYTRAVYNREQQPWKVVLRLRLMDDKSNPISLQDYQNYVNADSLIAIPRPMYVNTDKQTISFYLDNSVMSEDTVEGTLVMGHGFGSSPFKIYKKNLDMVNKIIKLSEVLQKVPTKNYPTIVNNSNVQHYDKSDGGRVPPLVKALLNPRK